jgi:MYXO-CTERM domain-containing protein
MRSSLLRRASLRTLLTSSSFLALMLGAVASQDARASWPPPPGSTPDQLKDPSNWPNDPGYGPHSADGKPDVAGKGGTWQYWSWMPPHDASHPVRPKETATGMSIDVAWTYTIGDPRVKIAVLDSGIKWDEKGLRNKAALNEKELGNAKPLMKDGTPCGGDGALAGFDCNKDAVFDLKDYTESVAGTPSVGKTTGGDFKDGNGNGVLDPGDLIVLFSDGKDDDLNGFTDDISGWDFFKDDNDPYDDTRYGHGTGEASDSTEEGNEGEGDIGVCPKCRFVPLRVGDSFIADVNDFAQAVTYGVDNGAKVIQEALGTVNQSNLSRAAIDYAYSKGVVVIASAADENSRHHNMPGSANHTVVVHAVQKDRDEAKDSHTFINYHPCTNYGGQAILSASGSGCASEATGRSSGIAGLLYSMGLQKGIELDAEEIRQLMIGAADLIDVPESYDPSNPEYDPTRYYPSKPTFSQRFGYGRQNAGKAVAMIADGKIPPEVDLVTPQWFEVLYPQQLSSDVELKGRITARFANTYDGVIEWAPGVDPDDGTWKQIGSIPAQPGTTVMGADGTPLGHLKVKELGKIDNKGEPENRYTITVRIRVKAHYGDKIGDVAGETRKTFYIVDDPTLVAGFPKYLGTSGEGSPRVVDLDGDGKRDILYPTADGIVHAYHVDGSELPGWPVKTKRLDGLAEGDTEGSPFVSHYLGTAASKVTNAWTEGRMPVDLARESVLSAPAVADVDGDGKPEIYFGTWSGTLYGLHADGTPIAGKWPIRLPDVPSCPRGLQPALPEGTPCMDEAHSLARGAFAGLTLVDMNKDGKLDVVSPAFDGKVYVFDSSGTPLDGFPVVVHIESPLDGGNRFSRIVTTAAVGDLNSDDIPEIAVGSNQYLGKSGAIGPFFVIDGRGNKTPGGPYLEGWPQLVSSFKLFPLVGEGIVSAGMMADIDKDGVPEVIFHGTGGTPVVLPAHPKPSSILGGSSPSAVITLDPHFGRLYVSPQELPGNNMIGVFSQPSVGDMDQDGHPDVVALGASFTLALALSSSERQNYEQQVAFWSTAPTPCKNDDGSDIPGSSCGVMFPGSPTIIEDYTFFHNSTIADVDGDDYPETLVGTGGYYVRAVNACGKEAKGFPKFTGQWIIPTVTVGDLDGDKKLEIVTGTRDGWLYAWHTEGREDGVLEWPTHHHDDRNTGNYATKIDFPGKKASKPLDLSTCVKDDGTVNPDNPGSPEATGGGACGCQLPGSDSATSAYGAFAALGLTALFAARRRRSR